MPTSVKAHQQPLGLASNQLVNDPGLAFIVVAGIILLVVVTLGLFWARRIHLRRALGTIDASICLGENRWQMGVCRYQQSELEWFRLLSLNPLPQRRMTRSRIELIGRRSPTEAELTRVPPETVIVELEYDNKRVEFAMKFGAYAGLCSWLEAGPVVGIGTWR